MGATFAKLVGGPLTNPGVMPPPGPNGTNGTPTFYPSQPAAAQALATASRATASGDTTSSTVNGILNPDGSENESVVESPTTSNPQPKMVTPNFFDAQASAPGSPLLNHELSSKGKALSLLLMSMEGAARGEAAAVPTNPHISPGIGPSAVAGFETPFVDQQRANELTEERLRQNLTSAQIAALPAQQQTERALRQAETSWYLNRGESVGEHNLQPGAVLVDRNGNTIGTGADLQNAAKAKATGKAEGTATAVASLGGTSEQVLSALGVRNPTPRNTNIAQLYLDQAKGDASIAVANMNQDKVNNSAKIAQTRASLAAASAGLTPAQQRQLNADPDYAAAKTEATGIARNLSKLETDQFALPGDVETARQNSAQAAQRMNAAKARVLGASRTPPANPASTSGASTVRMTGPKGTFDVPAAKVGVFQQNGYHQIGQ